MLHDHHRHRTGLVGSLVSQRSRAGAGRACSCARSLKPVTSAIELGPYGYLPNDPAKLQEQLDAVRAGGAGRHRLRAPAPAGLMGRSLEAGHRRGGADQGPRRQAHRGDPRRVAAPQDREPSGEP